MGFHQIHQILNSSCCFLNTKTAITRQLIQTARTLEAEWCKFAGKRGWGDKGRWVKYWAHLGCWTSPCYGLFWLGVSFETYELFISLIFDFFFRAAINRGYGDLPVLASSYQPWCPHGTTLLPLDGFSLNLIFETFSKVCRENSRFIKIWQE